jgi:hypothetical protein
MQTVVGYLLIMGCAAGTVPSRSLGGGHGSAHDLCRAEIAGSCPAVLAGINIERSPPVISFRCGFHSSWIGKNPYLGSIENMYLKGDKYE